MEDTQPLPLGAQPLFQSDWPRWRRALAHWVPQTLSHYAHWLRDLPAGRGSHTQSEEQWFAQALGRLHHDVANQLAQGKTRVDLREFGEVLNRVPGVVVSSLHRVVTDTGLVGASIAWPTDLGAFGRGSSALFESPASDAQSDEADDEVADGASASSPDSDDTQETDSEADDQRFQGLDIDAQRRLYVAWACDRWHEDNAAVLQNWAHLTHRQWLQIQQVLEQVRLQATQASVTVVLDVQWPASLLLSFDRTLRRIEGFMSEHQLGPCAVRWLMTDPLVPEPLRTPSVYLDQCRFKESVLSLHGSVRRLAAWLLNTWAERAWREGLSPQAPGSPCRQLSPALERLEQAVLRLHQAQAVVLDLSDLAAHAWQDDLRVALTRWREQPALTRAASRLEVKWPVS